MQGPPRLGAALVVVAVALVAAASGCDPDVSDPAPTTTTAAPCPQDLEASTVAYTSIDGVDPNLVSLDVYPPSNACAAPVVMWVHGGGYHVGDKANQIEHKRAAFNEAGWVLVSVNYRLTDPASPTSAQFPDHYDDVAASIAWVRSNIAGYGGDPERIAVLGHSAGADIVSNVLNRPDYLSAHGESLSSVVCAGTLDTAGFDKRVSGDSESAQWASALGNNPDYVTDTSATLFVGSASDVPDTIVAVRGTARRQAIQEAYATAVESSGAQSVLLDARGLSHAEVNNRIGAPGDVVMTPPLIAFLEGCFG